MFKMCPVRDPRHFYLDWILHYDDEGTQDLYLAVAKVVISLLLALFCWNTEDDSWWSKCYHTVHTIFWIHSNMYVKLSFFDVSGDDWQAMWQESVLGDTKIEVRGRTFFGYSEKLLMFIGIHKMNHIDMHLDKLPVFLKLKILKTETMILCVKEKRNSIIRIFRIDKKPNRMP